MLAAAYAVLERQHGAAFAPVGHKVDQAVTLLLERTVLTRGAQTEYRAHHDDTDDRDHHHELEQREALLERSPVPLA